jgi:methyl-accepting chemotaxis protein
MSQALSASIRQFDARGIKHSIATLGIRGKVLGGFGVVMSILAVVSVAAIYAALHIGGQFGAVSQGVKATMVLHDVDRNLLEMNRLVREFNQAGTPELLASAQAAKQKVTDALAQARTIYDGTDEAASIATTEQAFKQYEDAFNRVATQKTAQQTLKIETLDPLAVETTNRLDSAATAAMGSDSDATSLARRVLQRLLELRLVGEKALEREDSSLKDAVDDAIKTLKSSLGAFDERAKSLVAGGSRTSDTVHRYIDVFTQARDSKDELDALVNGPMADSNKAVTEQVAKIVAASLVHQKAIQDGSDSLVSGTTIFLVVISLIGLGAGSASAWLIGSGIAGAIREITAAMAALAGGDRSVSIPFGTRGDEIGNMARALEVFKDTAAKAELLATAEREEHAQQERRRIAMERQTQKFDAEVARSMQSLTEATGQLRHVATEIAKSAETTALQVTTVAASSQEASSNVQTVATAAEELASSVQEIGRQVAQSAAIASKAVIQAGNTNQAIERLQLGASRIGEVVTLIKSIAGQTNLLALNATIEAARAGDAGKGFAVVASEVKSLANQTAQATGDIAGQIGDIQAAMTEAVENIDHISATIQEINDISTMIAAAVHQQSAATQEIARNVSAVATGSNEVTETIGKVRETAEQNGAAASRLIATSESLSNQSSVLRQSIDGFMTGIKAA